MGRQDVAPSVEGRCKFKRPDCRGDVKDYPCQHEEREELHRNETGCDVDLCLTRSMLNLRGNGVWSGIGDVQQGSLYA